MIFLYLNGHHTFVKNLEQNRNFVNKFKIVKRD
jgi:hypothetical protein